ncbi:MAG TPA: CocE/NonD family hydrolase [Candidatus Ratteibacteria bacterium]|nr:CocE/NonD family hydrolase [Candidatus Ratteibacteria bacterium]
MQIFRNMRVSMRDGVNLSTNVFLPDGIGPWPVVLVRTAYNRNFVYDSSFPRFEMALVVQDCRGRYASEGEYYPFVNEANDGYDTLEWISSQTWCNGKIGMYGASYLAATQFYAAISGSKKISVLNPQFMAEDCWKQAYFSNGAFSLGLTWSWLCFETNSKTSEASLMPAFNVGELLRTLPLIDLDIKSGADSVKSYRDFVSNNVYCEFWKQFSLRDQYDKFQMPVLLTGGWYDYYPSEMLKLFCELRKHSDTKQIADSHRIIIGPWTHGINYSTTLGEIDFGKDSLKENDATIRWLDCILHEKNASQFQSAPIKIFVMGKNAWQDEYEWPPVRIRYTNYYLHSSGNIDTTPPGKDEKPDTYDYDPSNPVPTVGGNHSIGPYNPGLYELAKPGPYDQRVLETRDDVMVYTGDILKHDVEITGPIIFNLFASSSAVDTDFVVKLADVYPDGMSINISEGIIRARFRNNVWGEPELIEPGRVYEFNVDMVATSNVFKKGHRIKIYLTSSSFPLWDRNLNTGNNPAYDTQMKIAHQTIFHDSLRPSHIVLPIAG